MGIVVVSAAEESCLGDGVVQCVWSDGGSVRAVLEEGE